MSKINKRSWPVLWASAKTGKTKRWSIKTVSNMIIIEHGYEGHKLTKTEKTIHAGKNIGKANATTPEQQAQSEAQSKWQKQIDKGYSVIKEVSNNDGFYFPMLALTAKGPQSGSAKITKWPNNSVYVQAKLNGVRCLAVKKNHSVALWSRTMKPYDVPKTLIAELTHLMTNDQIWDGEIYVHKWGFERIISAVKKENDDTPELQFHRYDYPSLNEPMENRIHAMEFLPVSQLVTQVKSLYLGAQNPNDLWQLLKETHDDYVKDGYEGLIIRDPKAYYLWGHRGKELYKYKEFMDEEFRIIGYKQGSGSSDGAIVWRCRVAVSIKDRLWPEQRYEYFDVVPNGTIDDRKRLFKNGLKYIGKMLTVRFQAYSVYGVPIFPKGITIRDYE